MLRRFLMARGRMEPGAARPGAERQVPEGRSSSRVEGLLEHGSSRIHGGASRIPGTGLKVLQTKKAGCEMPCDPECAPNMDLRWSVPKWEPLFSELCGTENY